MEIGKPNAVYINIQDRKKKKFSSITVYGQSHEEVVEKIREKFDAKSKSTKKQ